MRAHLAAFFSVIIVSAILVFAFLQWEETRHRSTVKKEDILNVPSFQATTLSGQNIETSNYRGKILIVHFWASWCAPCIEEVPSLVKLAELMGEDIKIVAVSNDSVKEEIDIFLKSFPKFSEPLFDLVHDQPPSFPLTKLFGVGRLPESYIFDREGQLVRRVLGTIDWSSDEALGYMRSLVK